MFSRRWYRRALYALFGWAECTCAVAELADFLREFLEAAAIDHSVYEVLDLCQGWLCVLWRRIHDDAPGGAPAVAAEAVPLWPVVVIATADWAFHFRHFAGRLESCVQGLLAVAVAMMVGVEAFGYVRHLPALLADKPAAQGEKTMQHKDWQRHGRSPHNADDEEIYAIEIIHVCLLYYVIEKPKGD